MARYSIEFRFSKKGEMRFISHLDLMRLFMRAVRRAEIPVKMTEGFNPHPKISIMRALKLGVESEHEEARIAMSMFISPPEFAAKLQKQLPKGITITDVKGNFN